MSEPLENIGYLCKLHGRRPNPMYANIPLKELVGRFCKLAFPCPDGRNEYMWVKVVGLAETGGEELVGVLNNDPVYADCKNGDWFEFSRREIIDILGS